MGVVKSYKDVGGIYQFVHLQTDSILLEIEVPIMGIHFKLVFYSLFKTIYSFANKTPICF